MGVSRVDYDNEILIDISNDTVTSELLAEGETAHDSNGELITGTFPIGEVDTQADLIARIKSALAEKTAGGGSSGSGIIDVTELPTSNINENAVYRVTETIQTEKTEIYLYAYGVSTFKEYLVSSGVPTDPNIYVVDDLSNMLESDAQTFSVINAYILKSDGIVYLNVPAYGGIITLGLFGFQAMGYDRGFTKNIYSEHEAGVYTTLETYKQIVRWFVRKNGKWEEITAYVKVDTPHGFINTKMLSGDVSTIAYSASDILSRDYTEINENWFLKSDGSYVDWIQMNMFAASNSLKVATLPSFITQIFGDIFTGCGDLKVVTLKGKPDYISNYAFRNSYNDAITTINVPWAEGEVQGAPWGATNATINYNYTEG